MIKVHVFSGVEKQFLGITPDLAVGHLYEDTNSLDVLASAAESLGVGKERAHTSRTGLVHFDLWGARLAIAKGLFPIVSRRELAKDIRRLNAKATGDSE